ncbi:MAG: hypothetical protein ACI97A_004154 [Planctomycetota bacterium]
MVIFDHNETFYTATLPNQGMDDTVDSDFDEMAGFVVVSLVHGEVNNTVDFGVCETCLGIEATSVSMPAGWDPVNDPVLEVTPLTPLILGEPISFKLDTNFPGELGWIDYSLGNVAPISYAGMNFYIDVLNTGTNLGSGTIMPTDANGDLCWTSPDSVPLGFEGLTVIFQGRVCAATTGPP